MLGERDIALAIAMNLDAFKDLNLNLEMNQDGSRRVVRVASVDSSTVNVSSSVSKTQATYLYDRNVNADPNSAEYNRTH